MYLISRQCKVEYCYKKRNSTIKLRNIASSFASSNMYNTRSSHMCQHSILGLDSNNLGVKIVLCDLPCDKRNTSKYDYY